MFDKNSSDRDAGIRLSRRDAWWTNLRRFSIREWKLDHFFLAIIVLVGLTILFSILPRLICLHIKHNTFSREFIPKEHDDCRVKCENPFKFPKDVNDIISAGIRPRVVVSLTTSPKRLPALEQPLKSLLAQQLPPDMISVNLPRVFKRSGDTYEGLEQIEWLKHPLIKVVRCEDTGPSTKLLPTIINENDPDTLIITVDDDTLYPPELITHIVAASIMHPEKVIVGNCGDVYLTGVNSSYHRCNMFQAFAGVGFRRRFFSAAFDDYMATALKDDHCFRGDDFTVSNYFALNGYVGLNLSNYHVRQLSTGR